MSDETKLPVPKRPVLARLGDLALDAGALGGLALVTHGADLIYRPAAFIVAGGMMLAGCWLMARKGGG